MSQSVNVRMNPAVRMTPPSKLTGRSWLAENILERRRFKISFPAAAVIVAACRPQDPEQLLNHLAENESYSRSKKYWANLIAMLQREFLIVDESFIESNSKLTWLVHLRGEWSKFGWHEAAEYHCLAFDYPCVDYTKGAAMLIDRTRMLDYQSREVDDDRFKLDYVGRPAVLLPAPNEDMLDVTARELWMESRTLGVAVDSSQLYKVISLAFGQTGSLTPRTESAELLRRTSPSGGGRNPSEGYVVIRDVAGLEPGWFHVTMRPFTLRRLDGPPVDDSSLNEIFRETTDRTPCSIGALIIITSVFERNMYRYREPRTFRTVHMDAGHIASSAWMTAKALGLQAWIYLCDDAASVEKALQIDGMREGYMLTIAIAGGSK